MFGVVRITSEYSTESEALSNTKKLDQLAPNVSSHLSMMRGEKEV